jgi:TniQ
VTDETGWADGAGSPRTVRWPLHPPPADGEALSSWLIRLADVYGMTPGQLVRHNLGTASFELDDLHHSGDLDRQPPPGALQALHERTGVPPEQLAGMTIAGWVPWLLDTLDPDAGAEAYDTYVQQDCLILAPGEAVPRRLPPWRPWLTDKPMRRACPACVLDSQAAGGPVTFPLISQIPLTLSCPSHGCQLEPTLGLLGTFIAWQDPDVVPVPVDARVAVMDRRTHEGLTTGVVTLPGRPVHLGVWVRLLRTLLDEVNTPTSYLRSSARARVQRVWQAVDRRPRDGQTVWKPYEVLSWPAQQAMLHAAAAAMDLIEAGELAAPGTLRTVLCAGPYPPVHDGTPAQGAGDRAATAERVTSPWQAAMASLQQCVDKAREDPGTAQQLLAMATAFARDQDSYDHGRNPLIQMGVPSDFLPTFDQAQQARAACDLPR